MKALLPLPFLLVLAGCPGEDSDSKGETGTVTDADYDGYTVDEGDCDDYDASINPGAEDTPYDNVDQDCDGVDKDDLDGDGYGIADDCNDDDDAVYPGATETCNDVDDDCDGDTDEDAEGTEIAWTDADGDGYGDETSELSYCGDLPDGAADNADDCNDADASVNPGADDVCDGIDNDCDGSADNGAEISTWYADADGDGYGNPDSSIESCEQPEGYVADDTDCDDGDAEVNPLAVETCDEVDSNCDGDATAGAVDEASWYADADADGYGDSASSTVACEQPEGHVADATDCDDTDATVNPGGTEACDGLDNDCDGTTDDGFELSTWYADADGDSYGDAASSTDACAQPEGYVADATDCDDADADANPGGTESCDGADNDCDGETDEEGEPVDWYMDADADGYGDDGTAVSSCGSPGEGYVTEGGDCDDADATVSPAATEVCEDGLDNDCDSEVDESGGAWYADADADGYGDAATMSDACTQPEGYVADATDCDDADPAINPLAVEACDSVDNDCDGSVDEDASGSLWYADADGDGYGDDATTMEACEQPEGYVAEGGDCDDATATTFPGADEQCNGVDDDCDATIDNDIVYTDWYMDNDGDGYGSDDSVTSSCVEVEGASTVGGDCDDTDPSQYPGALWYPDYDSDGFGDDSAATESCERPADHVSSGGDCDDGEPTTNPMGTETCDSADNDCDGETDEAGALGEGTWYMDFDADGYGSDSSTTACAQPEGYVGVSGDCDDTTALAAPDAVESCDDIDNDCDGDVDEAGAEGEISVWYDGDGDGYGAGDETRVCTADAGWVDNGSDCDDSAASINPAATETCNGDDDDCDGSTDEAGASGEETSWMDSDGDGYGDADVETTECGIPSGYVDDASDCDDSSAAINPAATEACNGDDDDCDGSTDEAGATGETTTYTDADADGYGDPATMVTACEPPEGVDNGDDCDDSNDMSYPEAAEWCDGEDNDCDGDLSDEAGLASYWDGATWTDWTTNMTGSESSPVYVGDVSSYTNKMASGSSLYLCPGTWYTKVVFASSSTTASIIGRWGADETVLTTGGTGYGSVISVTSSTIDVEGFTITGGLGSSSGTQGGGVIAYKASAPVASSPNLTLTDCVVEGNSAQYGGGVAVLKYGWIDLVDTVITGNEASVAGGGVWMQDYGMVSCTATSLGAAGVTANTATYGGGIYLSNNSNGTVDFEGCDFGEDTTGDDNSAYDISINPASTGNKYCYTNATALTDAVSCSGGTCTASTDTTCP